MTDLAGSFGENLDAPWKLRLALGGVIVTVAIIYVIMRRRGGR